MIPIIYVITGCTASGKTDFSLNFAEKHNAEIISCDSLLVYKGMDIGTAKPIKLELERIQHHCIDICDLSENFNISEYIQHCDKAVNGILQKDKNIVVVGGTGFYLKSFFYPTVDNINISKEIEQYVDELYIQNGLNAVVEKLRQSSDEFFDTFDFKNPRRVVPALKRCLATGKSVKQLFIELSSKKCHFEKFQKHTILIQRQKEDLHARAKLRINKMIESGLVDEVKKLLSKGLENNTSCSSSIGYRETIKWLKHPTTVDQLKSEILQNTINLIKKQLTWFKNQIPIDDILTFQ